MRNIVICFCIIVLVVVLIFFMRKQNKAKCVSVTTNGRLGNHFKIKIYKTLVVFCMIPEHIKYHLDILYKPFPYFFLLFLLAKTVFFNLHLCIFA